MPVIVGGGRRVGVGCFGTRIRDETDAYCDHDGHDRGEQGPALETNLLALALASETSNFLC
ncbi:MAG: hypothetical protein RLZ84_1661 [Actinomycetota bacterium]